MKSMSWLCGLVCVLALCAGAGAEMVLVEAESFADTGGWVIDQQFMELMGSPYLLAHGLGVPVKDATTTVTVPAAGEYRVLVRTMDWVSPFGPGKFQVLVNGKALDATFGATGGGKWIWQDGGKVQIPKTSVELALKDMTGFEGRCDAILLVKDAPTFTPPEDLKAMTAWRKKLLKVPDVPRDGGKFDLIVVGGGIPGTCAAIAAARLDLKVALVQDRPVLGGNNSGEVQVWIQGQLTKGPFPHNGDIAAEIGHGGATYGNGGRDYADADERRLKIARDEKNLSLFLNTHVFAVEKTGHRVTAVIGRDIVTSQEVKLSAPMFIDCTGDGEVGFLAGADWRAGTEGKDETGESMAPDKANQTHMGSSNLWAAVKEPTESTFPQCPWAIQITEESLGHNLAKSLLTKGEWFWESGCNKDPIADMEWIRDHNFRAMYGTWDFLKNRSSKKESYKFYRLAWAAYIAGKRESRRLMGDHILTEQDVKTPVVYPDGCFTTTWSLDLHYPTTQNSKFFPGEEFRTWATTGAKIKPYEVPYRCLYSRNIDNLMMAGRDISVTHVALGTVRVMGTGGLMGNVVGRAAYLCKKHGCDPRDIYKSYLNELLEQLKDPSKR